MSSRFPLATAAQLRPDLALPEGKNSKLRKAALRSCVNNITLNNAEMLKLYPEVMRCLRSPDSGTKRLCFLYLETYVKSRPQYTSDALQQLAREAANPDSPPALRGVALRTLSAIPLKPFALETIKLCTSALHSSDVYLRKTACYAVAKAWAMAPQAVESSALIPQLNAMLVNEQSPIVLTAALQSLLSITDATPRLQFVVDFAVATRLARFLEDCPEFSQIAIYAALMRVVPQSSADADVLITKLLPGLRHSNTAVAMGSARVLLMLAHYASADHARSVPQQVVERMLPQLNRPPEIEYAVLRNVFLLLQTVDASVLARTKIPVSTFFFKASDPPYIRATKIDILGVLATTANAPVIAKELSEFVHLKTTASVRQRAVQALAKLGMRCESVVRECAAKLAAVADDADLDAITALTDLAKRYPQNSSLLAFVRRCVGKRELPVEGDAREAYFWALAQASTSAEAADAAQFFAKLAPQFSTEKSGAQNQILASCTQLYARFPTDPTLASLMPNLYATAIERALDPDVRDRAWFYSRLLQRGGLARAAGVVAAPLAPIAAPISALDTNQREDLELSLGYISSLYLKPAEQLFRQAPVRQLTASPALRPRSHRVGINADEEPRGMLASQFVSNSYAPHTLSPHPSQPATPSSPLRSAESYFAGPPAAASLSQTSHASSQLLDAPSHLRMASQTPSEDASLPNFTPTDDQNVKLIDL